MLSTSCWLGMWNVVCRSSKQTNKKESNRGHESRKQQATKKKRNKQADAHKTKKFLHCCFVENAVGRGEKMTTTPKFFPCFVFEEQGGC